VKTSVFLITLSFSSIIIANEEFKAQAIAKAKEIAVGSIEKRIQSLQSLKSCISSSTGREGMKNCRQEHKARQQSIKQDAKQKRQAFRAEQKAKRQEMRKQKPN
jgi:hypothetical protein